MKQVLSVGAAKTPRGSPTAEHVGADVGRAPALVFQQVVFTHQVLPQTEVRDGYSMSPGENQSTAVNTGHPTGTTQHQQSKSAPKRRCASMGLFRKA